MAAISSNGSGGGDHNVGASWSGGVVPGDGDTCTIVNGDTITVVDDWTIGPAAGASTYAITINSGGKLVIQDPAGSRTITLKGGIYTAGTFECGTEASPIPNTSTINFQHSGNYDYYWAIEPGSSFSINGSAAYGIENSGLERTQLATYVDGRNTAVEFRDAVDWDSGLIVYVGSGGVPGQTFTSVEAFALTSKTDASNYGSTGTIFGHYGNSAYGDIAVLTSRNIVVSGQNLTYGFRIYCDISSPSDTIPEINIQWCLLRNVGSGSGVAGAAFGYQGHIDNQIPSGNLKIKHVVFNTCTGGTSCAAIYFYNITPPQNDLNYIQDVHIVGNFGYGFYHNAVHGNVSYKNITGLDLSGELIYNSGCNTSSFNIEGIWYCPDSSYTSADRVALALFNIGNCFIDGFKAHSPRYGIRIDDTDDEYSVGNYRFKDGEIFNNYGVGLDVNANTFNKDYIFENIKFYGGSDNLFDLSNADSRMIFKGCSFDNQPQYDEGAVYLNQSSGGGGCIFDSCTFGTIAQNNEYNITTAITSLSRNTGRTVISNSTFVEVLNPESFNSSYSGWEKYEISNIYGYLSNAMFDWRYRSELSGYNTVELVNVSLMDSTNTYDYMAYLNPYNPDLWGFVGGSGEISKTHQTREPDGYIDGTYQRKFSAFNATERTYFTIANPIKIPVTSGETVTVTLKLKKNVSQMVGRRPQIHLYGCGIDTYDEMDDSVEEWYQCSVSGTASWSGTVEFNVSGHGVQNTYSYNNRGSIPGDMGYVSSYAYAYPHKRIQEMRPQVLWDGFFGYYDVSKWTTYGSGALIEKITGETFDRALRVTPGGLGQCGVQTAVDAGNYVFKARYRAVGPIGDVSPDISGTSTGNLWGPSASDAYTSWGEVYFHGTLASESVQIGGSSSFGVDYLEYDYVYMYKNMLEDGDMEASGVTAWTASGAILTKETGSRRGTTNPNTGEKILKVFWFLGGFASQSVLTVGDTYIVEGYARSDGNTPPIVQHDSVDLWTGTTSTDWQYFNVTFTATDTDILLGSNSNGYYVEFDDVEVIDVTNKNLVLYADELDVSIS